MYCFGITFILLHELSHFTLGHLHKDEEITDETDADIAAFWEINGKSCRTKIIFCLLRIDMRIVFIAVFKSRYD